MRGETTAGYAAMFGPLPWAWVRRAIAQRWNVAPWQVDDAPQDEVNLELQLMSIEAEEQPKD